MGRENNTYGVNEKPKGQRPEPPPAPPQPGCFNPIITPAPPPVSRSFTYEQMETLISVYQLQLKWEKESLIYYKNIVYDVCDIIDRNRGDGKRTVCGTSDEPTTQVVDTLRSLLANQEPIF